MIRLDAINRILVSAQLQPVAVLTSLDRFVSKAITMLDDTVLRELERGWNFNTDYDVSVNTVPGTPPAGTLSLDVRPENSGGKDIILRDGVLYDKTNQTTTFTETFILCDIATTRTFDNCPLVFQEYVVACAAVRFAVEVSVDERIAAQLRANEARAWQALTVRDETQRSTSIYQRWPLAQVFRRAPGLLG